MLVQRGTRCPTGLQPDCFKSEQQHLDEWELEHLAMAIKFFSEQAALVGGGASTSSGSAMGSTSLMASFLNQEMFDEKFRENIDTAIVGGSVSSFGGSKRSFKCHSRSGSHGVAAFFSHPEHHKQNHFTDGLFEVLSRTSSNSPSSRTGSSSSSIFHNVYPKSNSNSRPVSPLVTTQHGNRRFYKPPVYSSTSNSEDDASSAAEPSGSEKSMGRDSDKNLAIARTVPIDIAGSTRHRSFEDDRASNDSVSPSISLKNMDSERGRPFGLPAAASSYGSGSGSARFLVGPWHHRSVLPSPQPDRASRFDSHTSSPRLSSFGAAEYNPKAPCSPVFRTLSARSESSGMLSRESNGGSRESSTGTITPMMREAAAPTTENSNNSHGDKKVRKVAAHSLETWIFRTASKCDVRRGSMGEPARGRGGPQLAVSEQQEHGEPPKP